MNDIKGNTTRTRRACPAEQSVILIGMAIMFNRIFKILFVSFVLSNNALAQINLESSEQQAQQAEQIKEIFLMMKQQGESLITSENQQKQLEVLKNTLKHIEKKYKKDLIIPHHLQILENEKNI